MVSAWAFTFFASGPSTSTRTLASVPLIRTSTRPSFPSAFSTAEIAFPTAGSLVGQWLLGRKYIENWLAWLGVNLVSVGLFAFKGLWLTVLLYALFVLLSVIGWRAWRRLAVQP
mgnify:CR=1 FL=1